MKAAIEFRNVDIVFGNEKERAAAMPLIEAGGTREEVAEKTGAVIGCAGVNLAVRHGEISVLMGLSGSGKSTLLRAVNGLNKVQHGDVLVDVGGRATNAVTASEAELRKLRREGVAMVFQQFALLPWRTVAENVELAIALGPRPRPSAAARRARVAELLASVHLDGYGGFLPAQISGGMRQRTAVARAFASPAPVLIMDEPFGALDVQTRFVLEEELLRLWASDRRTIVFFTNDHDEALVLGDRIVGIGGPPATTGGALEVGLPRPRSNLDERLIAMRADVRTLLPHAPATAGAPA